MTETAATGHDLAQTLSRIAQDWHGETDETEILAGIVRSAVDTVPGVVAGGITQLVKNQRVEAMVPTSDLVQQCDDLQTEEGDGPCFTSIRENQTVIVNDMAHETRWPRFAARAAELGVTSLIAFQLYVQGDNLGALNLYGARDAQFDSDTQMIGEVFASHAAIALSATRTYRQMSEALTTRDAIGQAKGLLMARNNTSGPQAFNMLVKASQDTNLKLSDVAQWLVDEHDQPGEGARPETR